MRSRGSFSTTTELFSTSTVTHESTAASCGVSGRTRTATRTVLSLPAPPPAVRGVVGRAAAAAAAFAAADGPGAATADEADTLGRGEKGPFDAGGRGLCGEKGTKGGALPTGARAASRARTLAPLAAAAAGAPAAPSRGLLTCLPAAELRKPRLNASMPAAPPRQQRKVSLSLWCVCTTLVGACREGSDWGT